MGEKIPFFFFSFVVVVCCCSRFVVVVCLHRECTRWGRARATHDCTHQLRMRSITPSHTTKHAIAQTITHHPFALSPGRPLGQGLSALIASFVGRLEALVARSDHVYAAAVISQYEEIGFLIGFESLLSTHGSEVGVRPCPIPLGVAWRGGGYVRLLACGQR